MRIGPSTPRPSLAPRPSSAGEGQPGNAGAAGKLGKPSHASSASVGAGFMPSPQALQAIDKKADTLRDMALGFATDSGSAGTLFEMRGSMFDFQIAALVLDAQQDAFFDAAKEVLRS